MKTFLTMLMCACLAIAPLTPFLIIPTSVEMKMLEIEEQRKEDENENTAGEAQKPVTDSQVENKYIPKPNFNLDIEGYGTFGFNTRYFSTIDELCSNTYKVLKYNDQKSRFYFGFVTGLTSDLDVPGYITIETAGVDTVTNAKYNLQVGDNNWMVVPAKNQINGQNVYVYYLLSKDGTHAIWFRADISPESDNEELQNILYYMLDSVNVYYIGKTIFDTPNTGYYEGKDFDNNNYGENQGQYEENDEDNNVYKPSMGFTDAEISDNWDSFEVLINNVKVVIPCSMQQLIDSGFVLDDSTGVDAETEIMPNTVYEFAMNNGGSAVIRVTVNNESNSESKMIKDCKISKLVIDFSEFKYAADLPTEYVVLPGGVIKNIYTNDLLSTYGTPAIQETVGDRTKKYIWKSGNKSLVIQCGVVAYIDRIELVMG